MPHLGIFLDNCHGRITSGQNLSGTIVCDVKSNTHVRQIVVRFKGHEQTYWTEDDRRFIGDHDIIVLDALLFGEGTLEPRRHSFPFTFYIPDNLPGSYECSNGTIKYVIKAKMDRPMAFDAKDSQEITLISPIKLQHLPLSLKQPIENLGEKSVGCLCCTSGHIELNVKLERQAFVTGEIANVRVYCTNMSNTDIQRLDVVLYRKIKCVTQLSKGKRSKSKEMAELTESGVGAHTDKFYNIPLEIPYEPEIPNFSGCELFKCVTKIMVIAVLAGCHKNLKVKTKIQIGHEPYPAISETPPPPYNNVFPTSELPIIDNLNNFTPQNIF